jgi:PTH1 family peptidyl-tRNA hydrolase
MLIIGLGNPGKQYELSRHNIGFMVLDRLAERHNLVWREAHKGLYATAQIAGTKCHFLKPQTYMNLSGEAAGDLCRYYKLGADAVHVVYDELDFPYGTLKLKVGGSAGGHNGIKSLIQHLGTDSFARVRMGIAGMHRAKIRDHMADYVLAAFTSVEQETLDEFVTLGAEAVEMAVQEGFTKATAKFNQRAKE